MGHDGAPSDAGTVGAFGVHVGTVAAFDAESGLGTVLSGEGRWMFHCTTIADGTRSIDQGAMVVFRVAPGGAGRFEAFDVTVVNGPG